MTELWAEPEHPNLATALGGYVGSGAPLIAGFELAAVVILATSGTVARDVPLVGPTVLAMVVSAALMVFSIRYGFWAVSYWTTPAERLMWNPAAFVSMVPLDRERRRLAARMAHFRRLRKRAEHLFEFGLIVFLLALALLLVPGHWHAAGTGWRWGAVGVALAALAIHLVWTVGTWLHEHFARWYRELKRRSSAAGDRPDRIAGLVQAADQRLVRGLVLIWPPVRPASFPPPGPADAADLQGLRES